MIIKEIENKKIIVLANITILLLGFLNIITFGLLNGRLKYQKEIVLKLISEFKENESD